MRATLTINDILLKEVQMITGIQEKAKLIHLGLEALLRERAREELIQMQGSAKGKAKVQGRKRGKNIN